MKNTLKINHNERKIIMDRTFAKFAENTRSEEYAHLQMVRKDYPNYNVLVRTIKKNPNKNCYDGLTYQYMKNYIDKYEEVNQKEKVLEELDNMLFISRCHSKALRYPKIKKWFLDKYPNIVKFGMPKEEIEKTINLSKNEVSLSA
ncbi:MAG: hypothetical protein E7391_00735 [Ruminococcaceae bacterium]|nr:hypothetical protein [Oscillospiraceae bacterium]